MLFTKGVHMRVKETVGSRYGSFVASYVRDDGPGERLWGLKGKGAFSLSPYREDSHEPCTKSDTCESVQLYLDAGISHVGVEHELVGQ
jgi:hypothetical protein